MIREIKSLLRMIPLYNKFEDERLSEEFNEAILDIKEENSKHVFEAYYMPLAITRVLKNENYLPSQKQIELEATALMLKDLAEGKLTELYRFEENDVR